MKGKRLVVGCLVSGMAVVLAAIGARPERALVPDEAYALCRTMAAPAMAGRLCGDAGYTTAARWAERTFAGWGLRPLGGRPFQLPFPAPHSVVTRSEMALSLPAREGPEGRQLGAEERKLEAGRDFLPLLFSDSGDCTAGMVFVGWGISAPELGYDDYAGLEVKGRFVLCFRGVPDAADKRFDTHDEHRHRMATARAKGAAGLIYIYPEVQANPNGDREAGLLGAEISFAAADPLLADLGISAKELQADLVRYRRPLSRVLPGTMSLMVAARYQAAALGSNVAAVIPGSDPKLAGEWVVVGAHFDGCGAHLGMVFPGADDNASGSATVMAMAHAMARGHIRFPRSVVFVLFGGEEQGLRGSEHFAAHFAEWQRGPIAAMINFDMVGEGDGVGCGYNAGNTVLESMLAAAEKRLGTALPHHPIRGVGVRGSDFVPFFRQGVPCLSFWSNGPHLAYHQTGDTIYRINPAVLDAAARAGLVTLEALAGGS